MIKILFVICGLLLHTVAALATDITALPDLGTPATALDSLITYDESEAQGSRITEIKFDASAATYLNGQGEFGTPVTNPLTAAANITAGAAVCGDDGVKGVEDCTGISTSGIALNSGTISGLIVTDTEGTATHTLSATEYTGGSVLATVAGVYTLPAALAGRSGCVEAGQGVTAAITLTPASGDSIVHEGARLTVSVGIVSGAAAGDRICYRAYNEDDWYVSTFGTWVVVP